MNKNKKQQRVIAPSWKTYLELIHHIHQRVIQSGFDPDYLICIANGSLTIAEILHNLFEKPLCVMGTENWPEGKKAQKIMISKHVMYKEPIEPFGNVLMFDDTTESGDTFKYGIQFIMQKFPSIRIIKTATLWHKICSQYTPDYYAQQLDINPTKDPDGLMPWILKATENKNYSLTHDKEFYKEVFA